jgi:hypothetical protein
MCLFTPLSEKKGKGKEVKKWTEGKGSVNCKGSRDSYTFFSSQIFVCHRRRDVRDDFIFVEQPDDMALRCRYSAHNHG